MRRRLSVGGSGNYDGSLWTRTSGNPRAGAAPLFSLADPTYRLAIRRRYDNGSQIVRPVAGLRDGLGYTLIQGSRGKQRQKTKRRRRRPPSALQRNSTTFLRQLLQAARKMTGNKFGHCTARGETTLRQRGCRRILPSPQAADTTATLGDIGAPRPTRSRVTMTGSRFPGSRVVASDHLPRDVRSPVALTVVSYPPTVAGAAAELPE